MDRMTVTGDEESAPHWMEAALRDAPTTFALASTLAFGFILLLRRGGLAPPPPSSKATEPEPRGDSLDDEASRRRRRREHLAAVAERRAASTSASALAARVETVDRECEGESRSRAPSGGRGIRTAVVKDVEGDDSDDESKWTGKHPMKAVDCPREIGGSDHEEGSGQKPKTARDMAVKEPAASSQTTSTGGVWAVGGKGGRVAAKDEDGVFESKDKDDGAPVDGERTKPSGEEGGLGDKGDKNVLGGVEDDGNLGRGDSGYRERHARAIAKLMAKNTKNAEKEEMAEELTRADEGEGTSTATLSVHLIVTSSPGSPRVEIIVPESVTAPTLLCEASRVTGVPETEIRLIFLGRMITKQSANKGGRVTEDFGVVDGCAVHVVGKPRQRSGASGVGINPGSEEQDAGSNVDNGDTGEGGVGEGVGDGSSDSRLGDPPEDRMRADLVTAIRHSTGEGYYHRAAQRGDLAAIRGAVAAVGNTELLRVPDANGWTPLHEAARAGRADVAMYLVREAGLDVVEVSNGGEGWSPLDLALEHHGAEHPVTIVLRDLQEGEEGTADLSIDEMYD